MYSMKIKQDINNAYFNLIFFFIIIFVLIFFVYVSFVLSTKQKSKINISNVDYNYYENQTKLTGLTIPKEVSELEIYSDINFCPKGQCVIDLNNGSKRCPNDNTIALTFTEIFEVCSAKNSCDSSKAPFAVRPDGYAYNNDCFEDSPCICLSEPQCSYQITSTFDMTNGTPYGGKKQLNYFFNINTGDDSFFNKTPIIFSSMDLGSKFCKINPSFTDRIVNGCNLANTLNDPINCFDSSLIQEISPDSNSSLAYLLPKNYSIYSQIIGLNEKYEGYEKGDNIIYLYFSEGSISVGDDSTGILNFSVSGTSYNVYYSSVVSEIFTENRYVKSFIGGAAFVAESNKENYVVYTLFDILSQTGDLSWVDGFPITIDMSGDIGPVITTSDITMKPEFIQFTPCTTNIVGANYKNMLQCIQPENQPCTSGVLTYNVDKPLDNLNIYNQENSRNFCVAFDKTRLEITANKQNLGFYLDDPGTFTTSCMIGTGCGENFDTNLCGDDTKCIDAIKDRKGDFFSNYDDSAVTNFWTFNSDEFTINSDGNKLTINTPTLFNLELGDYWD